MSWREVLLAFAIPVMMVLVGAVSVSRYHDRAQSSWRGASYGMFATYEHEQARTVVVTAIGDDRREVIAIPKDLAYLADRLVVIPKDAAAEELADQILRRSGARTVVVEVRGHQVLANEGSPGVRVGIKRLHQVVAP